MKDKNEMKLRAVKDMLDKRGVFYLELANGQLQIDTVNLWVTTEKYYNTKTGEKGQGINACMKYLSENNFI